MLTENQNWEAFCTRLSHLPIALFLYSQRQLLSLPFLLGSSLYCVLGTTSEQSERKNANDSDDLRNWPLLKTTPALLETTGKGDTRRRNI
jgi:hypothetical protein